jgi:S1-C subfamily serine protease
MRLHFTIAAVAALFAPLAGSAVAAPAAYERLGAFDRIGVEQVCARAGDMSSAAWAACAERQAAALEAMGPKPRTDLMKPDERAAAEQFCKSSLGAGLVAYYRCLERQVIRTVPGGLRNAPPAPQAAAAPLPPARDVRMLSTAPSPAASSAITAEPPRPASPAASAMEWPAWQKVLVPNMPRRVASRKLEPADLFESSGKAVYVLLAAKSAADLKAMRDTAQASAVAVSSDMVITNCHAVRDRPVAVVAQEGSFAAATLYRADPGTDRCFLNVPDGGLTPVAGIRDFDSLKVGERVYTIGSPRGLQRSLGEGLVAGLRNRDGLRLIQTGAAAAPGSSGGGLFDAAGNLVGITTFAIGGEQVNFAIAAADYWR